MKRLIFALLFLVVVLAACATLTQTPAPKPTDAPKPTEAAKPTVAPTTAPAAKPFRVALIMPSVKNDLAFGQSIYDALVKVQNELGKDKLEFALTESMGNVTDAGAAIRDYASKGYDLILAPGSQYSAVLPDIALDFPKVAFAWGTTAETFSSKGVKNVTAFTVAADQGAYVLGVIAAKISKTGKFGLIGPVQTGDGKLHIEGFEAGIKATNPNATVSKVYTNDFNNAALMSAAAQTMVLNGADAFTGTSQAVVGAISVVKDKNLMWFGNQSEQTSLAPKNVVATQVYDWSPFFKQMIENTKAGKLGDVVMTGTLANKVLVIKYNPDFTVPADVKKLADDTIQGLIDGKIQTGVK